MQTKFPTQCKKGWKLLYINFANDNRDNQRSERISQELVNEYALEYVDIYSFLNLESFCTNSKNGKSLIPSTLEPILQTLSKSLALLIKSI